MGDFQTIGKAMTCRTILAPEKRVEANTKDWRFRGLELGAKSKSSDVYLVMRVNAKLALYIKALAFSMGSDISSQAEHFVRLAVHNQFCARGCPAWRGQFVARLMKLNDREALSELLDREQQFPSPFDAAPDDRTKT